MPWCAQHGQAWLAEIGPRQHIKMLGPHLLQRLDYLGHVCQLRRTILFYFTSTC